MPRRLKLTSLLFKRPCFSCVNDVVLILTSKDLHKKSSEAFIKMRSTQASLSYKGQVTMHATGNGRLLLHFLFSLMVVQCCLERPLEESLNNKTATMGDS